MNKIIREKSAKLSRRKFVVGSAAAGGGLALGFNLPWGFGAAMAQGAANNGTEVNIWVAIKPDDTCVIRIARSEMGQGTITGLAQLVAEELECDWNKVTTEQITPGPAAAAVSARRRTTSAAAVLPRASCCSRPRPTSGRCRSAS